MKNVLTGTLNYNLLYDLENEYPKMSEDLKEILKNF